VAATKVVPTNKAMSSPGPLLGKVDGCGAGLAAPLLVDLLPEVALEEEPEELLGLALPALFCEELLGGAGLGLVLVLELEDFGVSVVGAGLELLDTRW
jgi:hypothetical protein